MAINKRLLTTFLIVLVSACKEQLDQGVKETPRLTGLLIQIKVKSLEQTLTYTLHYDLEKKNKKIPGNSSRGFFIISVPQLNV